MSVDRLKRLFSKTVQDSGHDDAASQSLNSVQSEQSYGPVSVSPQQGQ